MDSKEREILELNKQEMEKLRGVFGLENAKCHYCGVEVTEEYAIFNKPTRLICKSLLCLTKAINEDEKEDDKNGRDE